MHGKEQVDEVRQKMDQVTADAQVSFECAMSIVDPHLSLTAPRACSQSFYVVPALAHSQLVTFHLGFIGSPSAVVFRGVFAT